MKTKILLLLIAIVISGNLLKSEDYKPGEFQFYKTISSENVGTEFVLAFHPTGYPQIYKNQLTEEDSSGVRIYVFSEYAANVTITIPGIKEKPLLSKKLKPYITETFYLKLSQAMPYMRDMDESVKSLEPTQVWEGRGIIVESDAPIIVNAASIIENDTEGMLVFPTKLLGKDYVISSQFDVGNVTTTSYTPYASVVGVYDDTKVSCIIGGTAQTSITFLNGTQWKPYHTINATINRGDTWLIAAEGEMSDLGGSRIRANKPVAVFSGNLSAHTGIFTSYENYIIEQEIPEFAWGKECFVPQIYSITGKPSLLRFFGKEEETAIYKNQEFLDSIPLNYGTLNEGWIEVEASLKSEGNTGNIFYSDKPICATLYNTNYNTFQMGLLSENMFQNEITIIESNMTLNDDLQSASAIVTIFFKLENDKIPDITLQFVDEDSLWNFHITLEEAINQKFVKIVDTLNKDAHNQYYMGQFMLTEKVEVVHISSPNQKIGAYLHKIDRNVYGSVTAISLKKLENFDTLAPIFHYNTCGGRTEGMIKDMPDIDGNRSNISDIYFNKMVSYNYEFIRDDFIIGETRIVGFKLNVIDTDFDAYCEITVIDQAGNDTTVVFEYKSTKIKFIPESIHFGKVKIGETAEEKLIIKNEGETVLIKELALQSVRESLEESGFDLDYDWSLDEPFLPNETREITIRFTPKEEGTFIDSIGIGDSCFFNYKAQVRSNVGMPIIEVSDLYFGSNNILGLPDSLEFTINNTGESELTIFSVDYELDDVFSHNIPEISTENPLKIIALGSKSFRVWFKPTEAKDYIGKIIFSSDASGNDSTCIINGNGIDDSQKTLTFIKPQLNDKYPTQTYLPIEWTSNFEEPVNIDLMLNQNYNRTIWSNLNGHKKFRWFIPFEQEWSSNYQVKIVLTSNPNINFTSDMFTIGNGASVDDDKYADGFSLSPNPAEKEISINFINNELIYSYEIYDIKGSKILSNSGIMQSNLVIDISKLPINNYIINLKTDKGNYSRQFKVMR